MPQAAHHLGKRIGAISPETETLPVIRSRSRRAMKRRGQGNRALSELSALASVVGLLAAATLAKFGVATQFFHLSH
jgi:hypothetical protein